MEEINIATITFTKEQVLELLEATNGIRPSRIIDKLKTMGYSNIQKFGRGNNTMFVCEVSDDSEEQAYYIFRERCLKEYGYDPKFDYDKALMVINFHIHNKKFKSIEEIADEIGVSRNTVHKHRKMLSGKIIKKKDECIQRTFGINSETLTRDDITELYDDIIMAAYSECKKKIYDMFPLSAKAEVALFRNKKTHSFEMIRREKETFGFIKDNMQECGNKFIASYPVWFDVCKENPYINPHLTQKIFQLIMLENGYDCVFFLRLYEITEDLKHDKELLGVIKMAYKHMENTINKGDIGNE